MIVPLLLPLAIGLAAELAWHPSLLFAQPAGQTLMGFIGYPLWCAVQQYLAQSYFQRRLAAIFKNPPFTSILVGVLFGAAHIPNLVLMIATTLAGWIFAEVFSRHANIWPLALTQAVGGILLRSVMPPDLIHNMRVGPGYFSYQPQ